METTREDYTILDEIEAFINRHIHLPTPHNARVMALMAGAAWAITDKTPAAFRALFAGEPESGKTTSMMITVSMCPNPVNLTGTEPSARSAILGAASTPELGYPVFYMDDMKLFGDSGMNSSRDLRADVLRRGYKRGETLAVSRGGVDKRFNICAPFFMSGLEAVVQGDIRTRCIILWHEAGVAEEYFDIRDAEPRARQLGRALGGIVKSMLPDIEAFRGLGYHPKMIQRYLEIWEPLLAVARHVGGQRWVNHCVQAFVYLTNNGSSSLVLTPRQELIRDTAGIMDTTLSWAAEQGFIPGELLGRELRAMRAYADMTDNGLLQHIAANMTGVRKRQVGGLLKRGYPVDRMKGYLAQDIRDTWDLIRPDEAADVKAPEPASPFDLDEDVELEYLPGESKNSSKSAPGAPGAPGSRKPRLPAVERRFLIEEAIGNGRK